MKNKEDLYVDDVITISLNACDVIDKCLKEYNIVLTCDEEDEIYVNIFNALEKISNGNYRKEM